MSENNKNQAIRQGSLGPMPWQRGWSVFKTIWPQLVYISMAAIAIPQYLSYSSSAKRAESLVQTLQNRADLGFVQTLELIERFGFYGLLEALISVSLGLWAYLAWIQAIVLQLRGEEVKTLGVLKSSLGLLLRKGLLTLLLLITIFVSIGLITAFAWGLSIVTQLLFITLCVLTAATPALLVIENEKSPMQIVRASLRMDYTKATGLSRWSAYFALLTYEMLLLGGLSLVGAGMDTLIHLDMKLDLPRGIWAFTTEVFPFGVLPMLGHALAICLKIVLASFFALLTTCFIFDLKQLGRSNSSFSVRI